MKTFLAFFVCLSALVAHPMGNFSVSHFSRLQVTSHSVELQYVLDLAEIPTFELLRTWKMDRSSTAAELNGRATEQAREWLSQLAVLANGRAVHPKLESAKATIADGAGNLPILHMDMRARIDAEPGTLTYEDENYSQRAGWKEIIVEAAKGTALVQASQSNRDLSNALTQYPPDPTVAPPQDLRAELKWKTTTPPVLATNRKPVFEPAQPPPASGPREEPARPVISSIAQPHNAPAASAPSTMTAQGAPAGSVVKGDFLSRLLHQRELSLSMVLVALAVSFGLGAVHALTPGHGKAIVAAYLVGSRGTLKHAAFLGAMVTFTHTITVFALGLATLFLFRFIVPEKITVVLGALSGISIVVIGALMLQRRIQGAHRAHSHDSTHSHQAGHVHSHEHEHEHEHAHSYEDPQVHSHAHNGEHAHTHEHAHVHAHAHMHADGHAHIHTHSHGGTAVHTHAPATAAAHTHIHTHEHHEHGLGVHTHSHSFGTHTHSHVPDEISWGGLVALGASGGLVPCESALVLLLGAIALGRVGLGLLLLLSFSLGLALVLMLIGVLVLYAKNLLPESARSGSHPFLRWASIASPAIVIIVGLVMTAASLGWIQAKWMIG